MQRERRRQRKRERGVRSAWRASGGHISWVVLTRSRGARVRTPTPKGVVWIIPFDRFTVNPECAFLYPSLSICLQQREGRGPCYAMHILAGTLGWLCIDFSALLCSGGNEARTARFGLAASATRGLLVLVCSCTSADDACRHLSLFAMLYFSMSFSLTDGFASFSWLFLPIALIDANLRRRPNWLIFHPFFPLSFCFVVFERINVLIFSFLFS